MNVGHMTTGGHQTPTTSSPFMGSQQMSSNPHQNMTMGTQMDSSPMISSTSNAMLSQAAQSQQASVQSMQASSMSGKDLNTAYLCRIGHETVQDIVSKTSELFQSLRMMSPPNGTQQAMTAQEEKKAKAKDLLKTIEFLFKRLRKFYERCNECCAPIDYIQIESLIPMKEDEFGKVDDKKFSNTKVKLLDKEHEELVEVLQLKNRQIKEVIDNLRSIVWDINTMLAMRKP